MLLPGDFNYAVWKDVWDVMPALSCQPEVLALIMACVFVAAASWTHRFVEPCTSLPAILLLIVHRSPQCCDPRRKRVASLLLHTPKCCLHRLVESDVPNKLLALFKVEFLQMEETGRCEPALFYCILQLRASLANYEHTMDIEGFNGWLQALVNRARRTKQASADARLSIMFGTAIDASQCAAMDRDIQAYMETDNHRQRYVGVAGGPGSDIPAAFAQTACEHLADSVFTNIRNQTLQYTHAHLQNDDISRWGQLSLAAHKRKLVQGGACLLIMRS